MNEKTVKEKNGRGHADTLIIRATTYNIHSCVSDNRKVNPSKVARIIDQLNVDIAALQEVNIERSANRNQAKFLAEQLNMDYIFFPVENSGLRAFGLAILTRLPIEDIYYDWLPNLYPILKPRKRGAIRAKLRTPIGSIYVINTHLSLYKLERQKQLRALMNRNWLMSIPENEPIIFSGDLNAGENSKIYRMLSKRLIDVQKGFRNPESPKPTFHAKSPAFRIDHMFVSKHINVLSVEVKRNRETQGASDHLPLIAELAIQSGDYT